MCAYVWSLSFVQTISKPVPAHAAMMQEGRKLADQRMAAMLWTRVMRPVRDDKGPDVGHEKVLGRRLLLVREVQLWEAPQPLRAPPLEAACAPTTLLKYSAQACLNSTVLSCPSLPEGVLLMPGACVSSSAEARIASKACHAGCAHPPRGHPPARHASDKASTAHARTYQGSRQACMARRKGQR